MGVRRRGHWTRAALGRILDRMSSETIRQATDPGHAPGSAGYRRVMLSMFAAGLATFVLLYSTQALLPAFVTEFPLTPTSTTVPVTATTDAPPVALLVAGPTPEEGR